MAPPGLFKTHKKFKSKSTDTLTPTRMKVNKVKKRSGGAAEKKGFTSLPAEIQSKIWGEAIQKPACHTFKLQKSRVSDPNGWVVHLHAIPKRYDPSAYRRWQSLLYCGPGGSSKLKNISFQTGFRRAMLKLQKIQVSISGEYELAAAIDVETDLVILEFQRGPKSPSIGWFQHRNAVPFGPRMNMGAIRNRMQHFRRVAVHYKYSHQLASKSGGPFSCYCPPGASLECAGYRACYYELGCFLDCFSNLEEFYLVVETKGRKEKQWAEAYRKAVREQRFRVARPQGRSGGPGGGTFELSHFYDAKSEYIQHCPGIFFDDLCDKVGPSPILRPGGPREVLVKALKFYRGLLFNEQWGNEQEKRDKVKFGMLLEYPLEGKK